MFPSSLGNEEVAQLNPVGIGGGWQQADRGQEEEQDKHELTALAKLQVSSWA